MTVFVYCVYIYISSWDLINTLKANPTIKEFE